MPFGESRTQRQVLEAWDRLSGVAEGERPLVRENRRTIDLALNHSHTSAPLGA